MTELKAWISRNPTLVYFLLGQIIIIGPAALGVAAYVARLETRMATVEHRVDKIVDVMTRDLRPAPP
jgi:hypothetical protein